jgi:nitrate/nitrite transport system permease protein
MLNQTVTILGKTGMTWFVPIVRLAAWEDPREQLREVLRQIGVPILTFVTFLVLWHVLAQSVQTSLGTLPGPVQVLDAGESLFAEHLEERARVASFYERQEASNARLLAADPEAEVRVRSFAGRPTYIDQIYTSLATVFTGFLLATILAVPLGILCGLSTTVQTALNPMIQLFRPVSPLAWLPIVTLVVTAVYVSPAPIFERAFLISAITVTLCSLWPTLINTAVGVASVDKDLINVSRVLRLSWFAKVRRIVLPSSLQLIFTGLRLSLGVGWMVLIAAEMLAQNPGLGKFVWDEFQNGSSQSLARIMVAVFTIGFIGFLLDRIMLTLQRLVSWGNQTH